MELIEKPSIEIFKQNDQMIVQMIEKCQIDLFTINFHRKKFLRKKNDLLMEITNTKLKEIEIQKIITIMNEKEGDLQNKCEKISIEVDDIRHKRQFFNLKINKEKINRESYQQLLKNINPKSLPAVNIAEFFESKDVQDKIEMLESRILFLRKTLEDKKKLIRTQSNRNYRSSSLNSMMYTTEEIAALLKSIEQTEAIIRLKNEELGNLNNEINNYN